MKRQPRQRQQLTKKAIRVKPADGFRRPEDTVVMEEFLDHELYGEGSVLVVLDTMIGDYYSDSRDSLMLSRSLPNFDPDTDEPDRLPDDDPYVKHFFDMEPEIGTDYNGAPRRLDLAEVLSNAKKKAAIAYKSPFRKLHEDAMLLALLWYTDFEGEVPPAADDNAADRARRTGMPVPQPRNMAMPTEKKLNFLRELATSDQAFGEALTQAVQNATSTRKPVAAQETDEAGFHGEPVGTDVPASDDAPGEAPGQDDTPGPVVHDHPAAPGSDS